MSGARSSASIILAVGISGIQQFGGAFWVEPMFNGVTLLIAIGFAGWTGRRRGRADRQGPAVQRVHAARPAGRQQQGELNDASDFAACMTASVLALAAGAPAAWADDFLDQAKATVKAATEKSGTWDGPTSGPAGMPGKNVVIVAGDLRNGGHTGVANGAAEAAKALGWTTRIIDGQGTVAGVSSAMSQAIALKPDGIIDAGFDLAQNMSSVEDADKQGIKMVAWHGGPTPGPVAGTPVFFNVTTDPEKVAEVSAMYAIADSDGKAGVVVFTDSAYAIAIKKSRRDGGDDQEVRRLHRPLDRGHAPRRRREPHAAADDLADAALRRQVDLLARHQRSLLRLHGPVAQRRRQGTGRAAAQHLRRRRQRSPPISASAPASSRWQPCPSR